MIVYRDLITGDEMLSDAFPLKEVVDADGNKVRLTTQNAEEKLFH